MTHQSGCCQSGGSAGEPRWPPQGAESTTADLRPPSPGSRSTRAPLISGSSLGVLFVARPPITGVAAATGRGQVTVAAMTRRRPAARLARTPSTERAFQSRPCQQEVGKSACFLANSGGDSADVIPAQLQPSLSRCVQGQREKAAPQPCNAHANGFYSRVLGARPPSFREFSV